MFSLGRSHLSLYTNLLFCLHFGCVFAESIIATVGEDVTLICNYDAKYNGKLPACWGRGAIPNRGCGNEVIKSDGILVISRLSERYLLKGNIGEGDVSLTIRQVEEGDSGIYGCRVEIPGWFNDHKHQLTLTVVAVRPNPPKIDIREVKERTVTVGWSPVFDGGKPITTYRIELKNLEASSLSITEVYNPQLTQLTCVDLHPAQAYSIRMFAINSVGISEASDVLTFKTKEAAPEGPPLDMQLEPLSSHTIKVTWKPPRLEQRNGVLRSYSISYREYDPAGRQFKRWQHLSVPATRELESVILSNLKPSAKYGVIIQAKTNAGIGPASNAPLCSTLDEVYTISTIEGVTAATFWRESTRSTTGTTSTTGVTSVPPDPPVVELKEVAGNIISILWIPGFEGDSPITGYYLESKSVNASWDYIRSVVDFSPNQTEATIIEMNPSTYHIRMFAKNSLATSGASNVLTITTGEAGHQRVEVLTTISTDTHAAASVDKSQGGHPAAIAVPVLLVVLVVGIVTTWKLLRIKQKKGNLSMWLTNGALRYRGAESLQEM